MKLLKIVLLAVAAGFGLPGAAQAEEDAGTGIYFRADAGWSFVNAGDEDGNEFVGGGGLGYQFGEWFRADVQADWSGNYDSLDYWYGFSSFVTVLGNAYLDIPTGTFITPYVGGGAGMTFAGGDNGFTFDLTGGMAIDLSASTKVDVGYRYVNIAADGGNIDSHQGLAGIRFGF